MKENYELMNEEELKKFFLTEVLLFYPSVEQEKTESEKLQVLYTTLKRINILLSLIYRYNPELHYMETFEIFGFYLVEKNGEKKKKHRMSAHLNTYGQFLYQLARSKDLIASCLLHNAHQLDALERVQGFCLLEDSGTKINDMSKKQNTISKEKETRK